MFILNFLALEFRILTLGQTDLGHALVDIATRIGPLQELETRIAEEYGTIDSVEVFQETKARTLSRRDVQSVSVFNVEDSTSSASNSHSSSMCFVIESSGNGLIPSVKVRLHVLTIFPDTYQQHCRPPAASTPPDFGLLSLAVMRTNTLHCVSDALFVEKCLTKELGVPKGRIQHLTDTQAHIYLSDPSIPSHVNVIRTSHNSLHRARHTSMASESRILLVFEEQRQG